MIRRFLYDQCYPDSKIPSSFQTSVEVDIETRIQILDTVLLPQADREQNAAFIVGPLLHNLYVQLSHSAMDGHSSSGLQHSTPSFPSVKTSKTA